MNTPVSLSLARLLKDKKFDEPCISFYDLVSNHQINNTPLGNYNLTKQSVSIPTIADVVMWLYKKHGIWIYADSHEFGKWCYNYKFNRPHELNPRITENGKFSLEDYNSPSEAYEAGIEYTLNNLI